MCFLGIDLGTSAVKLLLLSAEGKVLCTVAKEYSVYYPRPGWAEQNPKDWWQAVCAGVKEILAQSGGAVVRSIGLSGQMHGLVLLDGKDEVLMPALLWCDQRTQAECDYLTSELGDELSHYTGNQALTGFTAPKVLWVKKERPDVFAQIKHVLLPKDYLRLKLTGEYATEVSDASGTLFFDVANRRWSQPMLDFLGMPLAWLPVCHESQLVSGKITQSAAAATGLSVGTPVVGGGGDQAAGAVGVGVVTPGTASVALGTSGVVFACQEKYSVDKFNRLHSFCHANGKWHVMGVMLSAASCLKWWVEEGCRREKDFTALLQEAEQITAGCGELLFLPYLMGERTPYSDPNARGAFIGLNMTHQQAHMTRSVLEGVCYGLKDSLTIINEQKIPVQTVRVSGGGAKSALWRQILADVLSVRVEVVNSVEGPALGAAILAGVGVGDFSGVEEACNAIIRSVSSILPQPENVAKYRQLYAVYKQLYGTLQSSFAALANV